MDIRFRDYETHGIFLTIVNATNGNIIVENGKGVELFDNEYNIIISTIIIAYKQSELEIVFRRGETVFGDISIKDDSKKILLKVKNYPSPSIETITGNPQFLYKLYAAQKGGGSQYYLVIANDDLALSLYRPINSEVQSYCEFISSLRN